MLLSRNHKYMKDLKHCKKVTNFKDIIITINYTNIFYTYYILFLFFVTVSAITK